MRRDSPTSTAATCALNLQFTEITPSIHAYASPPLRTSISTWEPFPRQSSLDAYPNRLLLSCVSTPKPLPELPSSSKRAVQIRLSRSAWVLSHSRFAHRINEDDHGYVTSPQPQEGASAGLVTFSFSTFDRALSTSSGHFTGHQMNSVLWGFLLKSSPPLLKSSPPSLAK